jgi:hypothetical protein
MWAGAPWREVHVDIEKHGRINGTGYPIALTQACFGPLRDLGVKVERVMPDNGNRLVLKQYPIDPYTLQPS